MVTYYFLDPAQWWVRCELEVFEYIFSTDEKVTVCEWARKRYDRKPMRTRRWLKESHFFSALVLRSSVFRTCLIVSYSHLSPFSGPWFDLHFFFGSLGCHFCCYSLVFKTSESCRTVAFSSNAKELRLCLQPRDLCEDPFGLRVC